MIQFGIMNLLYCTLLHLMIIAVTGRKDNSKNHDVPEALTLGIRMKDSFETIELKRVNRVLANKFLRVWITTDKFKKEFEELSIMKKLGEFSFYHDSHRKSAFVLFHKRHELYGVIDLTYYVKRFPINEELSEHIIAPEYLHRMGEVLPPFIIFRSINNTATGRTRRDSKLKVYPELLIAISHDTYTNIEQDSAFSRGIATVSHMLTVYNAADMLYSLVRSVDIQLNIAGIVIEGNPNQWGFVSEKTNGESYIDVDTVHSKISKYFWLKQNQFPRHSYDAIIYHTNNALEDETDGIIVGRMDTVGSCTYIFPPDYHKDRYNGVIRDMTTYEHYATIAHEIGHLFDADHDGEGPYGEYHKVKLCGDSIMAAEDCSKFSLKWSPQTEVEFKNFLSTSQFYCNLMNYPRSLDVPEPKIIFSVEEQCQCYGYKSNEVLSKQVLKNGCKRPLECIEEDEEIVEVPLPMDGTPCDANKVCWNKECVKLKNENQCQRLNQ